MSPSPSLSPPQILKASVAIVVLTISLVFIMRNNVGGSAGSHGSDLVYYYNLQTGELFTASAALPPIDTQDGGLAARAYVYACGDCADPSQRFTAYIEMFTDDAKAAMANPTLENDADLQAGHLVAEPSTDPQWIPRMSDEAMAFEDAVGARCENPLLCSGE